jgi:hypothetical protein
MTVFDATNASITFTAPANGNVLVKIRVALKGASTSPQVLLGCIESSPSAGTVRGRQVPIHAARAVGSTNLIVHEVVYPITGLTPSASYTWRAAYGVETVVAATQFGWGGPNNTTASDAYGALSFEIWDTANLLGAINRDPGTAETVQTTTASVMAAISTTNFRLTVTAPTSGRIACRIRGCWTGNTSLASFHLGVMEGSTIWGRQAAWANAGNVGAPAATDLYPVEAFLTMGGFTGGNSYVLDAAWAVETVQTSSNLKWGGPDNATTNDAWGGLTYELWAA